MPQPPAVQAAAEDLIRVYRQAWDAILAEQQAIAADPRRFRRRARLAELRAAVEAELDVLDAPTRRWLTVTLPEVYAAGAEVGITWSGLHRSAVQQLASDTFTELLAATRYVRADTKRFVREAAKVLSEQTLTTGRTAQGQARGLARLLRERGIAAIRYRNGARHGLADYADTVLRTTTARAYNAGTVNDATGRGVEVFEVFDGAGCGWTGHGVGPEANGMIVTAEQALAAPLSHPRCQRGFSARPDLAVAQAANVSAARSPAALVATAAEVVTAARTDRAARTPREPRQPRRPRRDPVPA